MNLQELTDKNLMWEYMLAKEKTLGHFNWEHSFRLEELEKELERRENEEVY